MATQALPVPPAAPPRLRVGHSAGYVLTGFPLAVAAFVLLVTGFAVGIATLAITIGIVVLAGTLAAARTFARVERSRLDALLGVRTAASGVPDPARRAVRPRRVGRRRPATLARPAARNRRVPGRGGRRSRSW